MHEAGRALQVRMELRRSSPTEQLAAYVAAHHEPLVALLPSDTSCADLFSEVEAGRPIAGFFEKTEDGAAGRHFLRFAQMIELWLVEEKKKGKENLEEERPKIQKKKGTENLKEERPKIQKQKGKDDSDDERPPKK